MRGEAHFRSGVESSQSLAVLVCVRIVNDLQLGIEDADVHVRVVEDLPDLVSDRVVDTLDVELCRQRRLHAVDDGEFSVALFGFLEQSLRLVEQTGVFQRHAHAGGDGRQQAHVGIAEGVLAFVIFQGDPADHPVAAHDRDADHRLARVGAGHYADAASSAAVVHHHRLARMSVPQRSRRRVVDAIVRRSPCSYS